MIYGRDKGSVNTGVEFGVENTSPPSARNSERIHSKAGSKSVSTWERGRAESVYMLEGRGDDHVARRGQLLQQCAVGHLRRRAHKRTAQKVHDTAGRAGTRRRAEDIVCADAGRTGDGCCGGRGSRGGGRGGRSSRAVPRTAQAHHCGGRPAR
eukprot:scaffold12855_cov124-Isochrysis_galbana.AAC.2